MACAPARVAWTDAICLGAKAPENVGLIEVEVSFCGSERGLTILITKSCILHCDWLLDRTRWQQDGTRGSATECVLAIYMQQNKTLIFKPMSNYVYYITKDTGIKTTEVLDEILCEFP